MNLINVGPDEKIAALVPVREFSHDKSLIFATRKGVVKKTALSAYGNPRKVGLNAINVLEDDELIDVQIADGNCQVVLATREGVEHIGRRAGGEVTRATMAKPAASANSTKTSARSLFWYKNALFQRRHCASVYCR